MSILLGLGDGTFQAAQDFAVAGPALSVTVGDFNGDGRQDLATANEGNTVSILINNGSVEIEVQIDIKPGSFRNRIELEDACEDDDSRLPVAILTTPDFDALAVAPSTVELGDPGLSGTATPIRSRARDVDGDGDVDLRLVFSLCDLVTNGALATRSTELVLTGETLTGSPISGRDSVRVVQDDD